MSSPLPCVQHSTAQHSTVQPFFHLGKVPGQLLV